MKRKILMQELVDYLAKHAECDPKVAESFARAFFDVIEQGLLQDKFVKIKGFGTFKLISVSERESVNINTGERFQISSHTKVSFTPDNTMKELVNRPFAHFTSVELSDETDLKEFNEIDKQAESFEREEKKQDAMEEDEHTTIETQKHIEAENQDAKTLDTLNADSLTIAAKQSMNASCNVEGTEYPHEESTNTPDKKTENPKINSQEKLEEQKNKLGICDCDTPKSNFVPKTILEAQNFRYTYTEKPMKKTNNRWKTIALVLGVMILMVVSYLAGYFRVLCPCSIPFAGKWQKNEIEFAETIPFSHKDDTLLQRTSTPQSPRPDVPNTTKSHPTLSAKEKTTEKSDKKATEKKVINNAVNAAKSDIDQESDSSSKSPTKPSRHLVRKGDNVYKISRKYYGSDKYVQAIIKINKLDDANNIVVGKYLKLP